MKKNMNKCIIFLLIIVSFLSCKGQEKLSWKQKQDLKEADIRMSEGDYHGALDYYKEIEAANGNSPELDLKIGKCIFESKGDWRKTREYFERSSEANLAMGHYYLGRFLHYDQKFDEAISKFEKYNSGTGYKDVDFSVIERWIRICGRAKQFKSLQKDLVIENLGPHINSSYPDYAPVISADESTLIFTSRKEGSTGNQLDPYNKYFEDIYISYRKGSDWINPKSIGSNINSVTHDASVGLSPDGNLLLVYRTNKDLTGGDLYQSELQGQHWSDLSIMARHINSDEYQEASASFTPDNNTIYFSSNRPGGFGGKDIYKVTRLPDGNWSQPSNLGEVINSPYDEDGPFIHPDGKVLYFTSKGHTTMGGFDVFESYMNEQGFWEVPKNMGCPINTVFDDIHFVLSAEGEVGYYATIKEGGYGEHDIYSVGLAQRRPIIKGKIFASDQDEKFLKSRLTLFTEEGKPVGIYKTNNRSGSFIMVVSLNKKYTLKIEPDDSQYESIEKEIYLSNDNYLKKEIVKNFKVDKK
jgi:tetratricopeptide (TPR) repeat protein